MGRKEGVEAELVGVSERLGVAGGHERARRRRRVCSVAARERARGGEELGERVRGLGGVRGVADGVQGNERKQEVARGSRRWPRPLGRAPRLGPSGEEEDDRGSGDGLGRAAGPGGLPGERQVVLLSLSISVFIYLFCSVLF